MSNDYLSHSHFTHYRQGAVGHSLSSSVIKYFRHATCKYRYRAS